MVITPEQLAKDLLAISAIKLRPTKPFTWASGFQMPVYNDNRMLLNYPRIRREIVDTFISIIKDESISYDLIAGTSTAGIPWASILADHLESPMTYIRGRPKVHGLMNRIEGIDAEKDLDGRLAILIEDLISTGGSSASAVQGIRSAKGVCDLCLSIFDYGFDEANEMFNGKIPYDREGRKLNPSCKKRKLLDYPTLIDVAVKSRYINEEQIIMLEEWRKDPFGWGEKQGFPRKV